MSLRNTKTGYGSVAKTFHWLIFLLIAGMVTVGFIMTDMENGPDKFRLIGLHKSFGITVLALVCLRLGWKLINIAPPLPRSLPVWERFMAHMGHLALYLLMFAMPLSGWLMTSAAGFPVSVFGWFTLPNLIAPDRELRHFFVEAHEVLAWALIVMVSLHVLAALLHHFYYRNNVLRRMLPFTKEENHAPNPDTMAGC